jgi:hypothetical protein
VIANHHSVTAEFEEAFCAEVSKHRDTFAGKALPKMVTIHLLLLPLKSKQELITAFDERLKSWQ